MGKKQNKKATQGKEISQKTCATENEEDETGSDCCSSDFLLYARNGEDSESNAMDLEAVIKDQQRLFNKRESTYKDMISRLKRLYDNVTSRSKGLEAEIISLKADLKASNNNKEILQTFEEKGLEAEIVSLKEDLEKSNNKNE